jgi:hypothetical protein
MKLKTDEKASHVSDRNTEVGVGRDRGQAKSQRLKVKSGVKAGIGIEGCNHSQTVSRRTKVNGAMKFALARFCAVMLLTFFAASAAFAQTEAGASANEIQGLTFVDTVTPPAVPSDIQAPANTRVFLVGHATGTQNYVCLPSGSGVAWSLFTPQATLFSDRGEQLMTHFFSPNPFENSVVRATWESSKDTGMVWGQVTHSSTDPHFVTPGAIPWLLVQVVGAKAGPTGGDQVTGTVVIQRVHTAGGAAPITGCAAATDIGAKAFVPYSADYFFYKHADQLGRAEN